MYQSAEKTKKQITDAVKPLQQQITKQQQQIDALYKIIAAMQTIINAL